MIAPAVFEVVCENMQNTRKWIEKQIAANGVELKPQDVEDAIANISIQADQIASRYEFVLGYIERVAPIEVTWEDLEQALRLLDLALVECREVVRWDVIRWDLPGHPPQIQGTVTRLENIRNKLRMITEQHAAGTQYPEEVAVFCQANNVQAELERAIGLVKHYFPESKIRVRLKDDHEDEGQWVVVNVVVRSEPEEVARLYREALHEWARTVPWPASAMIRLTYSLA
jgi:hypothetical protein